MSERKLSVFIDLLLRDREEKELLIKKLENDKEVMFREIQNLQLEIQRMINEKMVNNG